MNTSPKMNETELHNLVLKLAQKVDDPKLYTSGIEQAKQLFKSYSNFEHLERQFGDLFEKQLSKTGKSSEQAKRHREFSEMYRGMAEKEFADKAFEHLNKTILYAPFGDRNFLFESFAQRSNLHYQRGDYQSALIDLDYALHFRFSYTCIERKVTILRKMDRGGEAYHILTDILKNPELLEKLSSRKQESLRKLRKEYKRFKGQQVEESKEGELPLLSVDSRIRLDRNPAQRYIFRSTRDIPSGVEVLSEEPVALMYRSNSLLTHCNLCHRKVTNTFWPCSECVELVFCSHKCYQAASYHRAECGILGLIQSVCSVQTSQAYRCFLSLRPANLDTLKQESENLDLTSVFGPIDRIELSQFQQWFRVSQMRMVQQIEDKKPNRTAHEFTSAFFLYMLYCFKFKVSVNYMDAPKLVATLATLVQQVTSNEYNWHSVESRQKIRVGEFQCLFGSLVGPSCDPNTEWYFDGKRFTLKTIKSVNEGEEICISYGCSKDSSLLARIRHLQNFFVMCTCARCMREVVKGFALRCEYCQGPVPYDNAEFKNVLCMVCEKSYGYSRQMSAVQQGLESVARAMTLVSHLSPRAQVSHKWLERIEELLSTFASWVYLHCDCFLNLVRDLCEVYIERGAFKQAIEWYQWLLDNAQIKLEEQTDNLLDQCVHLDHWTIAYLGYFEQKLAKEEVIQQNYLYTGKALLTRLACTVSNGISDSSGLIDHSKLAAKVLERQAKLYKLLRNANISEEYEKGDESAKAHKSRESSLLSKVSIETTAF